MQCNLHGKWVVLCTQVFSSTRDVQAMNNNNNNNKNNNNIKTEKMLLFFLIANTRRVFHPFRICQHITKTRLFKYIENVTTKDENFHINNSHIFHISAQKTYCGYPKSMFLSRNTKNNISL